MILYTDQHEVRLPDESEITGQTVIDTMEEAAKHFSVQHGSHVEPSEVQVSLQEDAEGYYFFCEYPVEA